MLKTPISFKGPNGLIQELIAEKTVYQATQLLLAEQIRNWHHNEVSNLSRAEVKDPDGTWHGVSMTWPLTAQNRDHQLGTCTCSADKPCIHLAALAIYNKAKLDQLPPLHTTTQSATKHQFYFQ